MDDSTIYEKLVDYLTETDGRTNPADEKVKKWILGSDENRKEYHDIRKIWQAVSMMAKSEKIDSFDAWEKVNHIILKRQIKKNKIRNLGYALAGMAASIIILFSLHLFSVFTTPDSSVILSTNLGDRSEVTLPDGSVVKLNSGSTIKYHFNSLLKIREVKFSGEGFFNVSKTGNPFVVTTPDGLQVRVLGTIFNLHAYPEDYINQTTLIKGKVELSTSTHKKMILKPGQIANFNKISNCLDYATGNPNHMLSWMDNKLYMDNMSLKEVCTRLDRWYDVHIQIKDAELTKSIHYSGVLGEETIIDVLDALCKLSPIQYKMKGKKIIITKNHCL